MKRKKNSNSGYIGIIMLLIGVAIMIFFIVRTDIFGGQKGDKTYLEQNLDAVDSAKDAKAMIEYNNSQYAE